MEETHKTDNAATIELMKAKMKEEGERVRFDIMLKYDALMHRHTEIINDMVDRRKKELAETQFLFD
jgi:hypothetical protein